MSELPYEIDAKYDLFAVLGHPHEIPYHSRPFMWTRDNYIEHVVTQAVRKFRAGQQHWLGFLIINLGGTIPAITDAQHRLTVYMLMLLACSRILDRPKHLSKISQYGHDDDDMPSAADAAILEKYQWAHIPNIRSVYAHDFEALGNVLNGVADTDNHSRIYDAYASVHTLLSAGQLLSQEELGPFLTFITKNTKVSRVRITDWNFTLEVFDSFNNIKVTVPPIYLLKNVLVRHGGKGYGEEIHSAFQRWETAVGVGAQFEQFMHVVGNLFVGSWNKSDRYVHAVETYLTANPHKGFAQFTGFVDKGVAMRLWLESNVYARLLSRAASGHEVVDYCVLPLLMMADSPSQVEGLIRRLLAFGIRSRERFSFNGRERFDALIGKDGVITAFIAGRPLRETIKAVDQLLLAWLGAESEADFVRRIATDSYKTAAAFNRARIALLYIAEMTDKHEAALDHTVIDIDHISPKTPKKGEPTAADPELLHRIGNFTPFIGRNSVAGLRGNRGLGNKPYVDKRESYAASNIKLTRDVASRYPVFADAEICERSHELATLLDRLTTKELTAV